MVHIRCKLGFIIAFLFSMLNVSFIGEASNQIPQYEVPEQKTELSLGFYETENMFFVPSSLVDLEKKISEMDSQAEEKANDEQEQADDKTEEVILDGEYEQNLDLLAHLIFAEAGSNHITDEHQILVAAVAINRVKSDDYPNTLYDVVYQPGQYACTWDGNIEKEPNQRAYDNAKLVLDGEYTCPANVIYSAEFEQGSGVYKVIDNTYFCFE